MKDMLYGDIPTFETVMSAVHDLKKEIVHNRAFQNGDTDVLAQMAPHDGTGIIKHHAADMQHPADDIDCMAVLLPFLFHQYWHHNRWKLLH